MKITDISKSISGSEIFLFAGVDYWSFGELLDDVGLMRGCDDSRWCG